MPNEAILAAMLRELNEALWAIEPRAQAVELRPLLDELYRYGRQFNMSELARDCGLSRNTMWRIMRRGKNMRFATLLRLCYYMGLRLRIETDPVPRRLAMGSHHPSYEPAVDKNGAWELGEP